MQENHTPHNEHFDLPRLPTAGTVAVSLLLLLGALIIWFALTAEKTPTTPPPSVVPAANPTGVSEQRIVLTDGRTMSCLFFPAPSHQISCDWTHARQEAL